MSSEVIGEASVRIRPDTSRFEGEARQQVQRAVTGLERSVAGISGAFRTVAGDVLSTAGSIATGVGIVTAAVGGLGVKTNSELETSRLQFETLLGSADAATQRVASLFEFARVTPFETGPIIKASRLLQTFGGDALATEDNLRLIGDAAAASSAGIDELAFWVGRAYAAMQAGQPFGEARMRLQELAVLSPQAASELEALTESGASADEMFAVLAGSLGRYSGAMEKQAGTLDGLTSSLSDMVSLGSASATLPLFEAIKGGLREILAFGDSAQYETLINLGKIVSAEAGQGLDGLVQRFHDTYTAISPAALIGEFVDARDGVRGLFEDLEPVAGLLTGIGVSLASGVLTQVPLLGALAPSISPLTGALLGLFLQSEDARESLGGLFDKVGGAARDELGGLADAFGEVADEVGSGVGDALDALAGPLAEFVSTAVPVLADGLEGAAVPVGELVAGFGELAGGVLGLATNLTVELGPALGVVGPVIGVMADGVGFLADHLEIAVPLLATFAAVRVSSTLVPFLSSAADGAVRLVDSLGVLGAAQYGGMRAVEGASAGLSGALGGLSFVTLGLTAVVGTAVGVYAAYAQAKADAKQATDELADALVSENDAVGVTADALRERLIDKGFLDDLNLAGLAVRQVAEEMRSAPGQMDEFRDWWDDWDQTSDVAEESFDDLVERAERAGVSVPESVQQIARAVEAGAIDPAVGRDLVNIFTDLDKAAEVAVTELESRFSDLVDAAEGTKVPIEDFRRRFEAALSPEDKRAVIDDLIRQFPELGEVLNDVGFDADEVAAKMRALLDVVRELAGTELSADQARRAVLDAGDRLSAGFGESLSLGDDEAGRRNLANLDALVEATRKYAELQATLDPTGKATGDTLIALRDRIAEIVEQAGGDEGLYQRLLDLYGLTDQELVLQVRTNLDEAAGKADALREQLLTMPGVTEAERIRVETLIDTGRVDEAAALLQSFVVKYDQKAVTIPVNVVPRFVVEDLRNKQQDALLRKLLGDSWFTDLLFNADGGVVDFARGGFFGRERHYAQIAPAGAWRVWAEPETGGEAYIPLAWSKRKQSLEIWREVGRRLGVTGFADGGIVNPAGGGQPLIGTVNQYGVAAETSADDLVVAARRASILVGGR